MLVDLSKKEMTTIIEALQFQMVESESLDDFDNVTNEEVGYKLRNLLKVGTCPETSGGGRLNCHSSIIQDHYELRKFKHRTQRYAHKLC